MASLPCLLLLALTFPGQPGGKPIPGFPDMVAPPRYLPLASMVVEGMQRTRASAAAIAISYRGTLLYHSAFGSRDPRRRVALPAEPLFRIASVSKPITAAICYQLVEESKLDLRAKIFPLLDAPPDTTLADPRWHEITVQHLLDHQGGWDRDAAIDPVFAVTKISSELKLTKPATPRDVMMYMFGQPLQFAPGARSAYSNFGYLLLGRVIEKAAGRPYADVLDRLIAKPLGTKFLRVGRSRPIAGEVAYPIPDDLFRIEVMDAHGGLIASAPALSKFLSTFWISGKRRIPGAVYDYTFFGSLPGCTAIVRQYREYDVAVLYNGRNDRTYDKDHATLKADLDKAIDQVAGAEEEPDNFAAIWAHLPNSDREVRIGLSEEELTATFADFARRGRRLVHASGHRNAGKLTFVAIWESTAAGAPKQELRVGLTNVDLAVAEGKLSREGLNLIHVDSYPVDGRPPNYLAVWEVGGEPKRLLHTIAKSRNPLLHGGRPINLTSIDFGAVPSHTILTTTGAQGAANSDLRLDLSAEDHQRVFDELSRAGLRPIDLTVIATREGPMFSSLWERGPGPAWQARHGLKRDELHAKTTEFRATGLQPLVIVAYTQRP